ncbi:MAG: DJ-1/PfpI family protein [Thermoplasmata archaeon]|nr:MAG: DJ-1/PfpI family protein [Thermoplasmata archaeon]
MANISGKKALMIIAPKNFRDEELFHTKEEIEKAGGAVTIASTTVGQATGMFGATANPNITIDSANVDEYDVIIFVGGGGSEIYFENPRALQIARDAYSKNKLVTAICIAPSILANAKLLQGRSATVWAGDKKYVGILERNGAKFTGKSVQVDGRIITANGPEAARKFGATIVKNLSK